MATPTMPGRVPAVFVIPHTTSAYRGAMSKALGPKPAMANASALVVQHILGALATTPALAYTADARAAFDAVRHGKAAAAVLLNPTKVEQVLAVADAGDVMPPKSTYFAPKVPSGLVLRPVA